MGGMSYEVLEKSLVWKILLIEEFLKLYGLRSKKPV